MERPKAITAAAIVSGALLAGSLGMTANAGILSSSGSSNVGKLSPVSETTAVTADAQRPEETAATPTPTPGAPEAAIESHSASESRTAPATVAGGRSAATPPVTSTKPKTEPTDTKSEGEKPETTTPHVTEPPEVTSTTASGGPTTTTRPRHDDDGSGTSRDD